MSVMTEVPAPLLNSIGWMQGGGGSRSSSKSSFNVSHHRYGGNLNYTSQQNVTECPGKIKAGDTRCGIFKHNYTDLRATDI